MAYMECLFTVEGHVGGVCGQDDSSLDQEHSYQLPLPAMCTCMCSSAVEPLIRNAWQRLHDGSYGV
jgi:hypothetical protein